MKEILLTRGYVALVDDEDFEALSAFKWHACENKSGNVYACRNLYVCGKQVRRPMHDQIMKPPNGMIVDHKDGNSLNDSRANMRVVTWAQNCLNKRPMKTQMYSKFKGVTYHKADGRWWARITANGVTHSLGYHAEEIDAAKAYDKASIELHGEFGFLNFPCQQEETLQAA